MLRPTWLRQTVLLLQLGGAWLAASGPELTKFDCRIVRQGGAEAEVFIAAEISDPQRLPLNQVEHSLISYAGQRITGLRFESDGRELAWQSRPATRLTRYAAAIPAPSSASALALQAPSSASALALQAPSSASALALQAPRAAAAESFRYRAEYTVTVASSEDLERVPLLVPSVRTPPGTRVVKIQVETADNEIPLGDSFPHFDWERSHTGSVSLANIPSFVKVKSKPAGTVTVFDRLADPAFLNDAFIILMIVAGSVMWKVWRHPARAL